MFSQWIPDDELIVNQNKPAFDFSRKWQFEAGSGIATSVAIVDFFENLDPEPLFSDTVLDMDYTTAFIFSSKYRAYERIMVKVDFFYQGASGSRSFNDEHLGSMYERNFALAIGVDFIVSDDEYIMAYMGLTYGQMLKLTSTRGTYEIDRKQRIIDTMQFTLAGLRIGERIGFVAECGFGYKGLLSGGFFARF